MSQPDPVQTFLIEAADLLTQIEDITLDLDRHPEDTEGVHRLFRAFHTLKGSGSMFGFDAVAAFTHHVETALDEVRGGKLGLTPALLALLLAARDQIQILLTTPKSEPAARECARIVSELETLRGAKPAVASQPPTAPVAAPQAAGALGTWRITFQPPRNAATIGVDPLMLLEDLRSLGSCEIEADLTGLPAFEVLEPEQCHLAWRIVLSTNRGLDAIKDVFIFVEDDSQIVIEPVEAKSTALTAPSSTAPVPAPTTETTAAPAETEAVRKAPPDAVVRVPSSKLDRLVQLVGELVINQSRLARASERLDDGELAVPVEAIERLVTELRDSVLGIRMMPIGSTFNRFKRLVHDLSRDLGKEVDLVTEGEETELDKTVLDQLGDPLVHLIRNCLDHAIEPPEERRQVGKSPRGTVRLSATHAGSHVVLAIQDDGRGLDTDRIRAKAVEKGLIAADATLSEKEIFNLIFLPGFSTAKQITNVSGRGVGMDVVRKQIEALRGSIQIASQRGAGTIISLRLPLTLAIIDGLLVELDGDPFILPMSAVMENVELHRADRNRKNGRNLIDVRGESIPYLRLRELFGLPDNGPAIEKIVIVRYEDERVGIVVDRVLGSHQTVIQSLGRFYRQIEVCSGSTIMGDGRVALILDLPGLLRYSARVPTLRAA